MDRRSIKISIAQRTPGSRGNNACTLRSNIYQREGSYMYAILLMKSLATGSIIYFFTLFPFKLFYPSFVEVFFIETLVRIFRR